MALPTWPSRRRDLRWHGTVTDARAEHASVVVTKDAPHVACVEPMLQPSVGQGRQVAVRGERRRPDQAVHVAAKSDMLDPDDVCHPRDADSQGRQVWENRSRWPDTNHAAGARDGARVIRRDQAAVWPRRCGQRCVRQHERLVCDGRGLADEVMRAVCDIDHDAEPVAAPYHFGAGLRQAAMHRWLGLDVPEVVDAVVRELEVTQRPALVGVVDAVGVALEEVAAFGRDDDGGGCAASFVQVTRAPHNAQALRAREFVHAPERRFTVGLQLAGLRVTERPDAFLGGDAVRWRVGDDGQAQHGHAVVAHRVRDRREAAAVLDAVEADDVAGVRVNVDADH